MSSTHISTSSFFSSSTISTSSFSSISTLSSSSSSSSSTLSSSSSSSSTQTQHSQSILEHSTDTYSNLLKSQIEPGISPCICVPSNSKFSKLTRLPYSAGIEPSSCELFATFNDSKDSNDPISVGNSPDKSLSATSIIVSIGREERNDRVPLRELE